MWASCGRFGGNQSGVYLSILSETTKIAAHPGNLLNQRIHQEDAQLHASNRGCANGPTQHISNAAVSPSRHAALASPYARVSKDIGWERRWMRRWRKGGRVVERSVVVFKS